MAIGGKIQALNTAIKEALPTVKEEAEKNPHAQIFVRAITFSDGAQWHVAQPTPIENFSWIDLSADGVTDMGKALSMVAEVLKIPPMEQRALPPVLVMISDGQPTDNFSAGLKAMMDQPWGKKSVRIAIAVGQDADHEVLQKFVGNPELKVLQANNPEQLVKRIKWAATTATRMSSQLKIPDPDSSKPNGGWIPAPPPDDASVNVDDVW